MDMSCHMAFGNIPPAVLPAAARWPKLEDLQTRKLFNKICEKHAKQHEILQRASALEQQATCPLTPAPTMEHERLDALWVEGLWHMDKGCRNLRMGAHPCSPELSKAQSRVKLCSHLIRRHKRLKSSSGKKCRTEKWRSNHNTKSLALEELEERTQCVTRECFTISKNALELQQFWRFGMICSQSACKMPLCEVEQAS